MKCPVLGTVDRISRKANIIKKMASTSVKGEMSKTLVKIIPLQV